ncbi:uroporphyrinogen-III synthase [Rhodovulum bhavnagarense]|uniref:Uroporphyrinogen-III synthase n=1 Tax=Rhodovulum bhavnagarense TaxID=992286 RepID=A0A4R2REB3_9RHOB|nr:uroporphyrinogen-III synthase [Rhodovulum bhavnagarense]TCP61163.1 uroporphyrinogen-III synthase [Rhodovulum bhavnagarense]
MSDSLPLLLLTRPRMQADRFARQFTERFGSDFAIAIAPVLEIVLYDRPVSLDGVGGVVFTSENGVAGLAAVTTDRTPHAYCVGDRTADAAREAGFQARSARGTAEELIEVIAADPPSGSLLHLRGEHVRGDICGALSARGFAATDCVVYDQRACEIPQPVKDAVADARLTYLPLFSPRSARIVSAELRASPARLAIISMSPAVTEAWTGPAPESLVEAAYPDGAGMLDAFETLIAASRAP